jgi:HK97 family phage portal protein
LRANVVSSTPVDAFRYVGGVQVEVPKTKLLLSPGGSTPRWQAGSTNHDFAEWTYSTQFDLGRYGNVVGIVTQFDSYGLPKTVELAPTDGVTFKGKSSRITEIDICGEKFKDDRLRYVWHERERTIPGSPVGLSPVMYAAMSIGGYLAAQQFGLDYFGAGAHPSGHLRNNALDVLPTGLADEAKSDFKAATAGRDIFVTGRSWEFTPAATPEAAQAFLDEMKFGIADVCRFFDVPGDMIDAAQGGSSVTYANITQRNIQLLVMNMGPAFQRREAALTSATPSPWFVKFNTDALLRMDPQTREELLIARVDGRVLAPSEARAKNDLPPFTPDQLAEFDALFQKAPVKSGVTA